MTAFSSPISCSTIRVAISCYLMSPTITCILEDTYILRSIQMYFSLNIMLKTTKYKGNCLKIYRIIKLFHLGTSQKKDNKKQDKNLCCRISRTKPIFSTATSVLRLRRTTLFNCLSVK